MCDHMFSVVYLTTIYFYMHINKYIDLSTICHYKSINKSVQEYLLIFRITVI